LSKKDKGDEVRPVIVKRPKKVAGGHHGGAWKVAYADFVTAMMAFFLLLWLLNVTTDEQKNAISGYFDPTHPKISENTSGAGGVLGVTSVATQGAMTSTVQPVSAPQTSGAAVKGTKVGEQGQNKGTAGNGQLKKLEKLLRKQEKQRFKKAAAELKQALESNEELKKLAEQLKIDITTEGLRIQIIDKDNRPMFATGSAQMYPYMQALLAKVGEATAAMPNNVSIRGHTDSYKYAPGKPYTNWELSADRANSSRRILLQNGLSEKRIANVMGMADTEPFLKDDPYSASNRRISIILLNEKIEDAMKRGAFGPLPPEAETGDEENDDADSVYYDDLEKEKAPAESYTKTPADVQFP